MQSRIEEQLKGMEDKMLDALANGGGGESAYDIAVRYGFQGTPQEWLESLKGSGESGGGNGVGKIVEVWNGIMLNHASFQNSVTFNVPRELFINDRTLLLLITPILSSWLVNHDGAKEMDSTSSISRLNEVRPVLLSLSFPYSATGDYLFPDGYAIPYTCDFASIAQYISPNMWSGYSRFGVKVSGKILSTTKYSEITVTNCITYSQAAPITSICVITPDKLQS